MKISRGINLHFRSAKYSNAAESYATQMSAGNRVYTIRNILTEAAEFRCQNCQFVSCRHKIQQRENFVSKTKDYSWLVP